MTPSPETTTPDHSGDNLSPDTPLSQALPVRFSVCINDGSQEGTEVQCHAYQRTGKYPLAVSMEGSVGVCRSAIALSSKVEWGNLESATWGQFQTWATQQAQQKYYGIPADAQGKKLFHGDLVWFTLGGQLRYSMVIKGDDGNAGRVLLQDELKIASNQLTKVRSLEKLALTQFPIKPNHQRVLFYFCYSADVVPPGCRNPRSIQFLGFHGVYIPRLNPEEVPIAFREYLFNPDNNQCHSHNWRWRNEKLWVNEELDHHSFPHTRTRKLNPMPEPEYWFKQQESSGGEISWSNPDQMPRSFLGHGLQDYIDGFNRWAESTLILDEQVWRATVAEPRLYVSYDVRARVSTIKSTNEYRSGAAKNRHYRIDQLSLAEDDASRHYDEDELPKIQTYSAYSIFIPEAVQLDSQGDYQAEREQQFEKNYERFVSHFSTHYPFNPEEKVRALSRLLAESQSRTEVVGDKADQS